MVELENFYLGLFAGAVLVALFVALAGESVGLRNRALSAEPNKSENQTAANNRESRWEQVNDSYEIYIYEVDREWDYIGGPSDPLNYRRSMRYRCHHECRCMKTRCSR